MSSVLRTRCSGNLGLLALLERLGVAADLQWRVSE
jgi:hypothetical protein